MLEANQSIFKKSNGVDDFSHILVVDDDSRIRSLLSRFLISEGYRVSVASNVNDAEEAMNDLIFDLIIDTLNSALFVPTKEILFLM